MFSYLAVAKVRGYFNVLKRRFNLVANRLDNDFFLRFILIKTNYLHVLINDNSSSKTFRIGCYYTFTQCIVFSTDFSVWVANQWKFKGQVFCKLVKILIHISCNSDYLTTNFLELMINIPV